MKKRKQLLIIMIISSLCSLYTLGIRNSILIGKSSRDIVLSKNIFVQSSYVSKIIYSENTPIGDFLNNSKSKPIVDTALTNISKSVIPNEDDREEFLGYLKNIPIRRLITISNGTFTEDRFCASNPTREDGSMAKGRVPVNATYAP